MNRMMPAKLSLGAVMTSSLILAGCGNGTLGGAAGDGDCRTAADQGVTDETIKLGSSMPLSGPVAGAGIGTRAGMQAWVDQVNSQGGIESGDGKTRRLELVVRDDAATPSRTLSNVNKLIDQDKVFALVDVYGTAANVAIRKAVDDACVPSVWPMTGAPEIGNPKYRWQTGGVLPSAYADGANVAELVKEELPDATVAIMQQNDDGGTVLAAGFKAGIEGSDVKIVETTVFEPTAGDLASEATTLAASQADVFLFFGSAGATQTMALQRVGDTSWKPKLRYVANFSPLYIKPLPKEIQDGLYHNENMLSVSDEAPAMRLYREWIDKDTEAVKQVGVEAPRTGWTAMQFTTETLARLSEITHDAFIDAMGEFTLPDDIETIYRVGKEIRIDLPDHPYPVTSTALHRWNAAAQQAEFIKVMSPQIPMNYQDLTKK